LTKGEIEVNKTKNSIFKWSVMAVVILLAGVVSVFALSFPWQGNGEKIKPANGLVSIPTAGVADGKARFYRINDGGKEIRFFVVKGADGAFHTAFDACDVCFRDKKGYSQQGDAMICRNCNKKFAIVRIGPHSVGGCNPSYLPHTEKAGNIIIKVTDIRTGAIYF
jgi:uncharacterized membrane protein